MPGGFCGWFLFGGLQVRCLAPTSVIAVCWCLLVSGLMAGVLRGEVEKCSLRFYAMCNLISFNGIFGEKHHPKHLVDRGGGGVSGASH